MATNDDTWRTQLVPTLAEFAQAIERSRQAITDFAKIDFANIDSAEPYLLTSDVQSFLQRLLGTPTHTLEEAIRACQNETEHFPKLTATDPLGEPQKVLEELMLAEIQLNSVEEGVDTLLNELTKPTNFKALELPEALELLLEEEELAELFLGLITRYGDTDKGKTVSLYSDLKKFHTQLTKALPELSADQKLKHPIETLIEDHKVKPEIFFTNKIVDYFLSSDQGKDAVGSWSPYWNQVKVNFTNRNDEQQTCVDLSKSAMIHGAVRKLGATPQPKPDGTYSDTATRQNTREGTHPEKNNNPGEGL